ncbi:MAG: radical SAM protein [Candidatus Margulisiibacteriota bacterium]
MGLKATIPESKIKAARSILKSCILCGHKCRVDRTKGETGVCGAGNKIKIASFTAHHGEEPFISGSRGSGAIFFSNCNLRCVFCQNWEISQPNDGKNIVGADCNPPLHEIMLYLQNQGCHNINLVSPTHFMPQILEEMRIAFKQGFDLPIVYNTNGFDSVELLELLDKVIDIYMPDIKYFDDNNAKKYSNASSYFATVKPGIREMFRQVGNLVLDGDEIARSGLLARHLVLPGLKDESKKILKYLAGISKDMWISIMSQYNPLHNAKNFPEINRKLTKEEYFEVIGYAQELGLENYLIQETSSADTYLPDFSKKEPFKT